MKKYDFTILIEKDEDNGFIASVPELIGCRTQGDTMVELLANVREAIEVCLQANEYDDVPIFNANYIETRHLEMVK